MIFYLNWHRNKEGSKLNVHFWARAAGSTLLVLMRVVRGWVEGGGRTFLNLWTFEQFGSQVPFGWGGSKSCFFPVFCFSCLKFFREWMKPVFKIKPVYFREYSKSLKPVFFTHFLFWLAFGKNSCSRNIWCQKPSFLHDLM